MIKFEITLEEENGFVHCHARTNPALASPMEVEAAKEFKQLFQGWADKRVAAGGKGIVVQPWGSPPKQN